ncbi:MAG TPA: vitamin K epoxide reductase family protein [Longimicrobiales bacterium]|nr:vitamin K epoxide reductase family protein [Longimicrobiales bacterium]
MDAVALSEERAGDVAPVSTVNRMAVAVLALIGVLISVYMSAYTFGVLGDIACGDGGCQIVQNSPWARFMGVPVPVIGLAGYSMLLAAAMLGVQPAFARSRAVPLVLAGGASIGLLFSAYLTYLEAFVIHAWCRWCIGSAILALLIFACVVPEFRRMRRSE